MRAIACLHGGRVAATGGRAGSDEGLLGIFKYAQEPGALRVAGESSVFGSKGSASG